jgi:hypothetical protein
VWILTTEDGDSWTEAPFARSAWGNGTLLLASRFGLGRVLLSLKALVFATSNSGSCSTPSRWTDRVALCVCTGGGDLGNERGGGSGLATSCGRAGCDIGIDMTALPVLQCTFSLCEWLHQLFPP